MEMNLVRAKASAVDADAVILIEAEGQKRADLATPLAIQYESGEIAGKPGEFTLVHGVSGFAARRVLVAGSGKPEKFDTAKLRKLVSGAVRTLKGKGVR